MKNAMKERSQYLCAYAPGNGFIAFVWTDETKVATDRPVTVKDVKKFMSRKTLAGHYAKRGWRIVQVGCCPDPVLAAPVKRISENVLEVEGRQFTYAIDKKYDGEIMDCELTLTVEKFEVRHISTRAQVVSFLNHEAELTEQAEGL